MRPTAVPAANQFKVGRLDATLDGAHARLTLGDV